ncbi:MAG: MFS transporter [Armatimonadetes bacterium]|nr:MFS transporter [Armatimonadota bacterium]
MEDKRKDKLSFGQKFACGLGAVAANFLGNGIGLLALPIYNIGLGVSASLIGLALGVPRILDAMLDPIMGHISDNTRSRWGRRRPYIIFGGIAVGLLFALLWNPNPHWSKGMLFGFFLAVTMLYYVMFTVWGIPYGALGFELSYDYQERTNIQAYKAFLAGALGFALPWLYKMCFWSWDKLIAPNGGGLIERISALTQKTNVKGAEVHGAGIVGIVIGAFIIITAVIPAICREKAEVQSQEKANFIASFKSTFKNKPYLIVTGVMLLAFFGIFMVQPLGLYLNIYYIFAGNREAAATMSGWMGTIYALTGILSTPLVAKLANMLGKKRALIWSLGIFMVGTISIWWFYTPVNPWLQVIPIFFFGPAWNCAMIVLPSMVADVCDLDELETGLRREGMYGAVNSWIVKLGIGAVTCVSGIVISLVGIKPEAATQSVSTITNMRLAFVAVPCLFMVICMILAMRYPVTEARAKEVRAILDARKEVAAVERGVNV